MRSGKWYFIQTVLLSAAIAGFAGMGCNKGSDFGDNEQVIRTPYSLYFVDVDGIVYNSNDGQAFRIKKSGDGVPARAVLTAGSNLLMAKRNLHLSADGGLQFNPVNSLLDQIDTAFKWPTLMINGFDNKVFIATKTGIQESLDSGRTWGPSPGGGSVVHSFARVNTGGKMYAIDAAGTIYEKQRPTDNWQAVAPTGAVYPGGIYHLTNFRDALIAGDATGANGVWFSNNNGGSWAQYTGLPTNQEIRSMLSPSGQGLLVGLDSAGIYRLVNDNFIPSNNGLAPFTTVYGMVAKQDIYKNEVIRQYVYIATSTGLYRSEDLGQNWALMHRGNIRAIY